MTGFSKVLRDRYKKKWGKMKGAGSGNLLNSRRALVDDGKIPTKQTSYAVTKIKRKKSKKKKSKKKRRK